MSASERATLTDIRTTAAGGNGVTGSPTGPQPAVGPQSAQLPEPIGELGIALRLVDRLSSRVESGKGGAATLVLLALVAGALGGAGAVALHASSGDGGVSKRVEALEDQLKVINYNQRIIAKAVGADLLEE